MRKQNKYSKINMVCYSYTGTEQDFNSFLHCLIQGYLEQGEKELYKNLVFMQKVESEEDSDNK